MKKEKWSLVWALSFVIIFVIGVGFALIPKLMNLNQYSKSWESLPKTERLIANNYLIPSVEEVRFLFTNYPLYSGIIVAICITILIVIVRSLHKINSKNTITGIIFAIISFLVFFITRQIGFNFFEYPIAIIFLLFFAILFTSIWICSILQKAIQTNRNEEAWHNSHRIPPSDH